MGYKRGALRLITSLPAERNIDDDCNDTDGSSDQMFVGTFRTFIFMVNLCSFQHVENEVFTCSAIRNKLQLQCFRVENAQHISNATMTSVIEHSFHGLIEISLHEGDYENYVSAKFYLGKSGRNKEVCAKLNM